MAKRLLPSAEGELPPTPKAILASVTAQLSACYIAHEQTNFVDRQAALLAIAGDYLCLAYDIHADGNAEVN